MWDNTGACVMTLPVQALIVWEGLLVSGSWDHSVKLWDEKGECVRTLDGHTSWVRCLALHEGKLVSGGMTS